MTHAFHDKTGQSIPSLSFSIMKNGQFLELTTKDLFENKKVIVFSLPGAYTPTCSASHLPRYEELAPYFFKEGIDAIYCVSVNDTFVMNAWSEQQKIKHVKMLPDGNGALTSAMGLLVDKSELGFGQRSWRYSMLVNKGVVETMFIEPDLPGDPFEVSDADTMLSHINPNLIPQSIFMVGKLDCPYCQKAKDLLDEHRLQYSFKVMNQDITTSELYAISGSHAVPQVFINGKLIGGYQELKKKFN